MTFAYCFITIIGCIYFSGWIQQTAFDLIDVTNGNVPASSQYNTMYFSKQAIAPVDQVQDDEFPDWEFVEIPELEDLPPMPSQPPMYKMDMEEQMPVRKELPSKKSFYGREQDFKNKLHNKEGHHHKYEDKIEEPIMEEPEMESTNQVSRPPKGSIGGPHGHHQGDHHDQMTHGYHDYDYYGSSFDFSDLTPEQQKEQVASMVPIIMIFACLFSIFLITFF